MKEIKLFNKIPTNKKEVSLFANDLKDLILSNEVPVLEALARINAFKSALDKVLKDKEIDQCAVDEADKYGHKTFDDFGVSFQVKETGVKYDYANCGDIELNDLLLKQAELTAKIKAREGYLKKIKEPVPNTETGEMINPPAKSSKTKVCITLK